MRVSTIQIAEQPGTCELRAQVQSDRSWDEDDWFEPFPLWYRFPASWRESLCEKNGDPFLAALLVPAMRLGERLIIDAPVSGKLLAALPEIQAIYASFDRRLKPILVEADDRAFSSPGDVETSRNGLFFSMGVDSFYSLLKNERDHPDDRETVTHLLSVHGFDAAHGGWDERFPSDLLEGFQTIAAEKDKTLVSVVTNVRNVGARLAPWTMMHGGALASVALALGPAFSRVTIAASATYATLSPWGTHPLLDPLWSNESLTVVHDGCEMDTIDKTWFVSASPLVMAWLRVCPGYGSEYNCGRCMKCQRTMLDLLLQDRLDRCRTLPHEIDPETLRIALRMPTGPVHLASFRRRQQLLELRGDQPELNQVLIEHLTPEDVYYLSGHPRRVRLADRVRMWRWRGR